MHVLGIPNYIREIQTLCKQHDVILLEDTCEAFGSTCKEKPLGSFGLMSSFSMYYSHQLSTIEGGMICTNDSFLYEILLSLRCHGWDRDLNSERQNFLRTLYSIDDFKALYTFYYPGFNLRSTDLQAFIGLNQLKNIDAKIARRADNFYLYHKYILYCKKFHQAWDEYVPGQAYPLFSMNRHNIVKNLTENNIESRPLICGSIGKQPFWKEAYGEQPLPNADLIHEYGFYIPNYPELTEEDIIFISNIINNS